MNVSRAWLQKYFDTELPSSEELAEVLTFHSSEVEEVAGDRLDVKVLPDRAPYALSHRGIAYELAAALNLPLKNDPLRNALPEFIAGTSTITVALENPEASPRYMATLVEGVTIGPSPAWLKEAIESVGQRSINNVVDATNYVMLNIGQPLHAFDAAKLSHSSTGAGTSDSISISVRGAQAEEKITTLTGEEYILPEGTMLITDAGSNSPLGIAGVKGGKAAEVTAATTSILIESANFNGKHVRKASQALKLWTDASLRFQNKISPELAAYGMRDVLALILEVAGGTLAGVTDTYPNPEAPRSPVSFTREMITRFLGADIDLNEMLQTLDRLSLEHIEEGETVTVKPPFERRDLVIWQDFAEEIGRVLGYDRITSTSLPMMEAAPDQARWNGIERIKDMLVEHGFTELSTQAFAGEGAIQLANPLQADKPWLRASLKENMTDALKRAANVAPRVLGPDPRLKLFELGSVFTNDSEHLSLCLGYTQLSGKASNAVLAEAIDALMSAFPEAGITRPESSDASIVELSLTGVDLSALGAGYAPVRISLTEYRPYSLYPSALRDIAVWTPEGTMESEVAVIIQEHSGDLLARMDLFDRFDKTDENGTRTSYAFRLVFQAEDRTLSDTDIDPVMTAMTDALNEKLNWEVR